MSQLALAGIQTAAGIGSQLLGQHFYDKNVDKQTEANKELAKYSYDLNLQQWHNANQYNSPKAQMQRFKEAGLNPNLIYGQGSAGNASSSPQHTPTKAGLKKKGTNLQVPMIQNYNNQRQVEAGLRNTDAATAQTHATTDLTEVRKTGGLIDNAIQRINEEERFMGLSWKKGQNLTYRDQYGLKKNNYQAEMNTKWNLLHKSRGIQNQLYQMQAKKMALIDGQTDLALMDLMTKKRAYKWQNVNNIANIAGKAIGLGIGGKFAKGSAKRLTAPTRQKFSKYSYNDYKQNRDIQPNTNF